MPYRIEARDSPGKRLFSLVEIASSSSLANSSSS